jgi:hypothetical protein
MTLNGEILKAYNNLPAIPIEQPLGDLPATDVGAVAPQFCRAT